MKQSIIGETNIASNQMKMTIIEAPKRKDITVQFEDGTIVKHRSYSNFKKGLIANPSITSITAKHKHGRVGETNISSHGQKMTIIKYNAYTDIAVKFEDGTVAEHKCYKNFQNGNILNPTFIANQKLSRVGETNIAANGQKMTIIAYRKSNDIDVEFEDKTIVTNKSYKEFQDGHIKNPNYTIEKQRLNETNIASNGMQMTIIAYRNAFDIDIEFEDGQIVYNKAYKEFKNGHISYPNMKSWDVRLSKYKTQRLYATNTASDGRKMTVITYRNADDIDVEFDDGTIVEHTSWYSFKDGRTVQSRKELSPEERMSQTNIAVNGLTMKIIAYRQYNDIDVQFEDGCIVKHKQCGNFDKGIIKHPFPYKINNITMTDIAYKNTAKNEVNFFCKCNICHQSDIWSLNEIKQHQCINIQKGK